MMQATHVLNDFVAQNLAPAGAVAQFANGRVIGCRVIGERKPNIPFGINSKVRVASISKLITGFCAHQLALAGKLNLDADCSVHLGFSLRNPNNASQPITTRMILSHTSGIRDGDNYQGKLGETLQSFFVPDGVNWAGGAHWAHAVSPTPKFAYSNLGYGVLAQIIENITKQRFDLAAKNLILGGASIDGGFNWSGISDELVSQSSPLYRRAVNSNEWRIQVDGNPLAVPRPTHNSPNGVPLSEYVIGTNGLLFSPQGGLRASIMDLMKLAQILLGKTPLFSPTQITELSRAVWEKPDQADTGSEREVFQSFGSGIHRIEPDGQKRFPKSVERFSDEKRDKQRNLERHSDAIRMANALGPIIGLKHNLIGHFGEAYGLLGGVWVSPATASGFAWFVNGSLGEPQAGARTNLFAIEENMMQACAEDLGMV